MFASTFNAWKTTDSSNPGLQIVHFLTQKMPFSGGKMSFSGSENVLFVTPGIFFDGFPAGKSHFLAKKDTMELGLFWPKNGFFPPQNRQKISFFGQNAAWTWTLDPQNVLGDFLELLELD